MHNSELQRLREAYDSRRNDGESNSLYTKFHAAYLFEMQNRERVLLRMLKDAGINTLNDKTLLEVGCGSGGVLLQFLSYGTYGDKMFGVDILDYRLADALKRLPFVNYACSDGQHLPYMAKSFDIVCQYTAFSSILEDAVKINMAREMQRVCRDDGLIIWYDFWLNPFNPQTKGIRLDEIKQLFPQTVLSVNLITLAPPVARRIVPISWSLAAFLERLKVFNSHYLVIIQKTES